MRIREHNSQAYYQTKFGQTAVEKLRRQHLLCQPDVPKRFQGMPVSHVLALFSITEPTCVPGARLVHTQQWNNFTLRRFEISNNHNPPTPKDIIATLSAELINPRELALRAFDFLFDQAGQLIAIFPHITSEDFQTVLARYHNHHNLAGEKLALRYIDLSPYYFQVPANLSQTSQHKWLDFINQLTPTTKAIKKYRDCLSGSLGLGPDNLSNAAHEYGTYLYIQINRQTLFYNAQMINLNSAHTFAQMPYFSEKYNRANYQIIIPVFPSVYPSAKFNENDRTYQMEILFRLQSGNKVLVIGPGPGTDSLLAHYATGSPIFAIGKNPFEVANLRATAEIAGFKVVSILADNIANLDGTPHLPNERFDWVIWNMPCATPATQAFLDSLRRKHGGHSFWDDDLGGRTLQRFVRGLPLNLERRGQAIVWNSSMPYVERQLKETRHPLEVIKLGSASTDTSCPYVLKLSLA